MSAVAGAAGYLVGSLPTAVALGRLWGVDLRASGSGNPGANNALRLGGPYLAASVLLIEIAKGTTAVAVGAALAGGPGAVAGGVGAVAGNVFNVWYRFAGGKGLAISAGSLLAAAPTLLLPALVVLTAIAMATRSSGRATLAALVALDLSALGGWFLGWPTAWGVDPGPLWAILAAGVTVVLVPRHLPDANFSEPPRPRRRGPGSPAHR